jgi:hypothetical protein
MQEAKSSQKKTWCVYCRTGAAPPSFLQEKLAFYMELLGLRKEIKMTFLPYLHVLLRCMTCY